MKEHNHNLHKIYFRKFKKDDLKQEWRTINGLYFCDECNQVIKLTLTQIKEVKR